MRILVIDGDVITARALELMLTNDGFNVTLADTGEESPSNGVHIKIPATV